MASPALEWLACPLCRSRFAAATVNEGSRGELGTNSLKCDRGHTFPVVSGVPRLLPGSRVDSAADARAIQESFTREWQHFDYEDDRTWGQTVAERREDFLRHVDLSSASLPGKLVLDAGCGNGALSAAISSFGCRVLATDISDSVFAAHRHLSSEDTHFVQSDLMHPAFNEGIFDIVYCAGVLHHTPDTRATLENVAKAVAPGGSIFVWLYWRVPGWQARLSEGLRRVLAPLPAPVKHAVVLALLLPQSLIRERLRARRRRERRSLNWREILVRQLDSFTPRYRWVHTPEEVHRWYEELGFVLPRTTERGEWGFGVVARRPSAEAGLPPSAEAVAAQAP
jgi:SAM-dependent methyltransferase/uncharacterized protein YbaR (Trm112 family)